MNNTAVNVPDAALRDAIAQAGLDTLDGAFAYRDGDDLHKPNLGTRRRTRVVLRNAAGREWVLFLKRYGPEPFRRRLWKWMFSFGSIKNAAHVEFDAITQTRAAGVPTMEALVFGQDGWYAGGRGGRSFLLVSAVPGEALERQLDTLAGPQADATLAEKLAPSLADLVQTFHRAGLVHRDLYASHIFLARKGESFDLHLIDLARVFRPKWRTFRWRVKDLAALHFSLPQEWRTRHWKNFLDHYLGDVTEKQTARWATAIEKKSRAMSRRAERKNKTG